MKSNIKLMNLFWTTAGVYPGEGEISPYDFKERVEASAKAGFKGIGIWLSDIENFLRKISLKETKMILDDNGIEFIELEFLIDWFTEGEKKRKSDIAKRKLLQLSEALNAKHIKAGDFNNTKFPMTRIVDAFASLCKEAEEYGAVIGFEFMGVSMLNNLKDSLFMVEQAGARNGGLIIDLYHVINLGITYDEFKKVPLQYLINLELNDGRLKADSADRKFCGEGEFDIKGFIKCAEEMGYEGPWGVEIFSKELLHLSPKEMSSRAFKTTMAQFKY